MADDNTHALIKEVLNETLNRKLEKMIARILRAIEKQPMKYNFKTSTQLGPAEANPTTKAVNPMHADFFDVKNKVARVEKEHAKGFELMNEKFEKLKASLKKQDGELGFYNTKDFNIKVEEGLPEKFKMLNLPKFNRTEDPRDHLRSYLIIVSGSVLCLAT